MNKNEIINKVKFMEMALEQNEKLNLLCRPNYNGNGGYTGLELFFLSENMTENAIINKNNYFVVLKHSKLDGKKIKISDYMYSCCKCNLNEVEECACILPTREKAEEHWYNIIIEGIEKRSTEIKSKIGEM